MGERRNVVVLGFNVVVMVSLWVFCFFFGGVLSVCFWVLGFFCGNDWPVNKQKVCTGGKGIAHFHLPSESTWYNDFEVCN